MKMIYGTAWKESRTAELVSRALRQGFRAIDTACQPKHYNEAQVGEGIIDSGIARDALFIQTKFSPIEAQDPNTIPYEPTLPLDKQVAMSCEVSLNNLHVSVIDSYLLHSTMMPMKPLMQIWRAMEALVDEGKVGQIGVSNCYDIKLLQRLYEEARIKPTVVQNRFYNQSGYDVEIRAFCKTMTMQYQSFWSLTANAPIIMHDQTRMLAQKYAKTPVQIYYRFLIQLGITPLNGTTSLEHMQEDLEVFNFELEASEVEGLYRLHVSVI
jgi:diketogulonate reductase-like aldo/keto reductase